MEIKSFLNVMRWVRVTPRARGAAIVLVFALLPFIGHYAWFFGEHMMECAVIAFTAGVKLPLSISAPGHQLYQTVSISLAGFAGFVWALREILNYVQRAADCEMGE